MERRALWKLDAVQKLEAIEETRIQELQHSGNWLYVMPETAIQETKRFRNSFTRLRKSRDSGNCPTQERMGGVGVGVGVGGVWGGMISFSFLKTLRFPNSRFS